MLLFCVIVAAELHFILDCNQKERQLADRSWLSAVQSQTRHQEDLLDVWLCRGVPLDSAQAASEARAFLRRIGGRYCIQLCLEVYLILVLVEVDLFLFCLIDMMNSLFFVFLVYIMGTKRK